MCRREPLEVAILLATYNGEMFVEQQLRSLGENRTRYTLHWLDDCSTDNTRQVIRAVAGDMRVDLREHHAPKSRGVPAAFFDLLECAEADIYLFCDQDDIWEPGKIDTTVAHLLPAIGTPALCFSDPLVFKGRDTHTRYHMLDILGTSAERAMQESRVFMSTVGYGNTQGFTQGLKDLYLAHKDIARTHALMHDVWMYAIAMASGTVHMLSGVPTTLYRRHDRNVSGHFADWSGNGRGRITMNWRQIQRIRRAVSRHAKGFIFASPSIPAGPKLDRILEVARLVAKIDHRLSLTELVGFIRKGVTLPNPRLAMRLAAACLYSDA